MQSTKGSFVYMNNTKKTKCSWSGSVVPKQNKTFRVRLELKINADRTVVDVDASANKDATINLHGNMTTMKNGKTMKKPIHLDHYSMKSTPVLT